MIEKNQFERRKNTNATERPPLKPIIDEVLTLWGPALQGEMKRQSSAGIAICVVRLSLSIETTLYTSVFGTPTQTQIENASRAAVVSTRVQMDTHRLPAELSTDNTEGGNISLTSEFAPAEGVYLDGICVGIDGLNRSHNRIFAGAIALAILVSLNQPSPASNNTP